MKGVVILVVVVVVVVVVLWWAVCGSFRWKSFWWVDVDLNSCTWCTLWPWWSFWSSVTILPSWTSRSGVSSWSWCSRFSRESWGTVCAGLTSGSRVSLNSHDK